MTLLHTLSLTEIGSYNISFKSHSTMLVERPEAYFESVESAARFGKAERKEEFLSKVSNEVVRKARRR